MYKRQHPISLITEHIIDPLPVPVLASNDSTSITSHLIQTWSMKSLLKQLLDSTIFTDRTNNCQLHYIFTPIQVEQPVLNSYCPYTDGIFAYNSAMNIHYYVIRHSHLLLNQNQEYVPILSMKRRKEVFLGTYVIQDQDIYNNALSINRSDGLFTALFLSLIHI